ncbi:Predicted arabinose efflux permease, MFS family [Actinopolymorpha cephalotaxi]|uniref:MFS family arabinose efflux permease n=1 Tax=Actinopolymorpha cephalotaxi TaxID=504797 RepID=A0A1I2Z6C9_9ACTN|nr:MFS transporter [Actinopolymorpha cephalotaxi]NYH81849.1 putative MFS family arabinose efflux permease [Actinopolymorpha cephalotaxi]SFH32581.1 Predicted arabinose efflux permease, MFS family [Actinopolymorpha cephalotaxi]
MASDTTDGAERVDDAERAGPAVRADGAERADGAKGPDPTGEAPADPPVPLHRNRDFRRLWIGQACSELGSGAAGLAYPLLVLALTGSPLQAGLAGTVRMAAGTVLGLPAGALVDRWNRRRVLIGCEALRAGAAVGLVLAIVGGWASLPLILVVAVIEGGAGALFGPAQTAAVRHIVPAGQLPTAAARNEARGYAAELAGPPLGGALFALARWAPFLADAISYVVSLVAVWLIRRPLQEVRTTRPEPLGRAVRSGLRFVVGDPFLRAVLVLAPLANAAFAGVFFVLVVVLLQRGTPPAAVGAVQSAIMVGGLLGALAAPWLQPRIRIQTLIVGFLWVITGLVAAAAFVPGTYLVAGLLALAILPSPTLNAGMVGYQIAITPDHMQGRVDSAIGLLAQCLQPLAPLLGGAAVTWWGGRGAFLVFAGILAVAAVVASLSKGVRNLRPL